MRLPNRSVKVPDMTPTAWIIDEAHVPREVPWEEYSEWSKEPGHWTDYPDGRPALRRVGETGVDGATVSTVFLSLDHAFGAGPPILFESMIFDRGGPYDEYQERYRTWAEAEEGHARIVAALRAGTDPADGWPPEPRPAPEPEAPPDAGLAAEAAAHLSSPGAVRAWLAGKR